MQHPEDYEDVDKDYPDVEPTEILPVLQSFLESFAITPNWKDSRFLMGFVMCILRKFLFGMSLNDRVPKKLNQLVFERIVRNIELGNFGKGYAPDGGIFNRCAIDFFQIRRIPSDQISRTSANVLHSSRNPKINEFVATVFMTALCPKRGVSVHEMKLMIYLLRRICESLLVDFRIVQNYFDFTDRCYDCCRSEYPDNDPCWMPRKMCFELLEKILGILDMFEQQHSRYPSMRVLFGRLLK